MPIAVRVGALRGRSLTWCSRWSRRIQRSMNGHRAAPVKSRPSGRSPGMNTFQASVCPQHLYELHLDAQARSRLRGEAGDDRIDQVLRADADDDTAPVEGGEPF